MALSSRFLIPKIIAPVTVLAKLHNFCFDQTTPNKSMDDESLQYLCCDMKNVMTNELGFFEDYQNNNNYLCHDLTSGVKRFNDYP